MFQEASRRPILQKALPNSSEIDLRLNPQQLTALENIADKSRTFMEQLWPFEKPWVESYDAAQQILDLYQDSSSIEYDLSYSANSR
jgi:hypothetical protein